MPGGEIHRYLKNRIHKRIHVPWNKYPLHTQQEMLFSFTLHHPLTFLSCTQSLVTETRTFAHIFLMYHNEQETYLMKYFKGVYSITIYNQLNYDNKVFVTNFFFQFESSMWFCLLVSMYFGTVRDQHCYSNKKANKTTL